MTLHLATDVRPGVPTYCGRHIPLLVDVYEQPINQTIPRCIREVACLTCQRSHTAAVRRMAKS